MIRTVVAAGVLLASGLTHPVPAGIGCQLMQNCQINRNISGGQMGPKWDDSHITPHLTPDNAEHDTANQWVGRIHWTWKTYRAFNRDDQGIVQVGSWNMVNGFDSPVIYYRCDNESGTNRINITFGSGSNDTVNQRAYANYVGHCDGNVHTIAQPWGWPLNPVVVGIGGQPADGHPFIRVKPQRGGVDINNELTLAAN